MTKQTTQAFTLPSRGFILRELLVVIAIIAILAAILFPVFQKVRENAPVCTGIGDGSWVLPEAACSPSRTGTANGIARNA